MKADDAVGPRWYVFLVAPNQELPVAVKLIVRQKSCLPYVPCYADRRRQAGGRSRPQGQVVTTQRPLFPGYVLARFDIAHRSEFTNVPGIVDLLKFGGVPAVLTEEDIEFLHQLEEAKAVPAVFNPGDMVEITEGAFAGRIGRYEKDRKGSLVILIEEIGRAVRVEMDRDGVKAA